jgi:hypothetical protein
MGATAGARGAGLCDLAWEQVQAGARGAGLCDLPCERVQAGGEPVYPRPDVAAGGQRALDGAASGGCRAPVSWIGPLLVVTDVPKWDVAGVG